MVLRVFIVYIRSKERDYMFTVEMIDDGVLNGDMTLTSR